jgi:hypothetical protein
MTSDEMQNAILARIQQITKHELSEHTQAQQIIKLELACFAKDQHLKHQFISDLTKSVSGLADTF